MLTRPNTVNEFLYQLSCTKQFDLFVNDARLRLTARPDLPQELYITGFQLEMVENLPGVAFYERDGKLYINTKPHLPTRRERLKELAESIGLVLIGAGLGALLMAYALGV